MSRQTIYAIEAGTYVPNTEVALNLARELEVTVDELFTLQQGSLEVARIAGRRGAQRGSAGKRPAGADLPYRIALGQHSGQRVALLHARSRWHHQANRTNQRTRRPGGLREGGSGSEAAGVSRMRPGNGSAFANGGKDQRRGDRFRRCVEQTRPHVAERRKGTHRRLASGGSQDRGIQPAVYPPAVSRTRISASSRLRAGRKDS